MKVCYLCKVEKPLEEFSWRNKKLNQRHSYCKPCRRNYDNALWQDGNKKKTKKETRLLLRKKREEFLIEELKNGCVDCGSRDIRVLQFDHLRDKVANVTQMLCDGYSIARMREEIKKCEVVCANCHSIRTQERSGGWRLNYYNDADMV